MTGQLSELYRPVAPALDDVREVVGRVWADALGLVQDGMPGSPQAAGGKLLRPALCLLSAGACGADDLARFVPLAASMELLHLAALAHDDVIDGANLRRGALSLKAQWNNHAAVLGGDYLVARAIRLMGSYGCCEVITAATDSMQEMAEGELTMFGRRDVLPTREECIELARRKTATLFSATCSTPCYLIPDAPHEVFARFGLGLGVAFQLVDDLLDLTQDEAILGKPSCGDLTEGKVTLPVLCMRGALDPLGRERLDGLRGRIPTAADRRWVSDMLEATGARDATESTARSCVYDAQAALAALPASVYKESLLGLAEFSLIRDS